MRADAAAEYAHRLDGFRACLAQAERREEFYGNARVAAFVLGLIVAGGALIGQWFSPLWLVPTGMVFLFLVHRHGKVLASAGRSRRAAAWYERGLARLAGQWPGTGQTGERFQNEQQPFALDLDLFGKGSLFELLSTARLRAGEDILASWLTTPALPAQVRERQVAVAELRPLLDLREDLALQASSLPPGLDLEALADWAKAPLLQLPAAAGWLAVVLPVLALGSLLVWALFPVPLAPFLLAVLLEIGFTVWMGPRIWTALKPVERRARDLSLLAGMLARLEREPFTAPLLRRLQQGLYSEGLPPSRQIARLVNLIDLLNSQRNQLFMPLAFLLLWSYHLAVRLERWRGGVGPALAHWLETVGQFEALCALASYAYEHPDDPFPEVVDEGPCFEGEGLGHPFLPGGGVRNALQLGGPLRLLIVSGSNMSGKSTFLRTVGVNAVLALAGAPVRATRLKLSRLALGATLRVQDSLQSGRSRFYAEVTRIRQLLDLAGQPPPLLFLLDELLHGTNSHDRRVGAEGVLRGLLERGAIGLITTHDLSVTDLAQRADFGATNAHFRDHFENGQMVFDYQLRPGVVPVSNALALMRAIGLEV
ncbi:MAG: DNA mismatch repair protein MutS [Planctomycetia bacterium]|nr:DNA mismatch repair protein MutS [Planctomycetia bacterium]